MGLIHIYCGCGKGKTTAAIGAAVRAAGAGMRVELIQLLKGSETSELNALRCIPGIRVTRLDRDYGFTFTMSDETKAHVRSLHDELLCAGLGRVSSGQTDMLIVDEFFRCVQLRNGEP